MTCPLGSALFAEAEGKFFFKNPEAQVEFVKDAAGTITHVVVRAGGATPRQCASPKRASMNYACCAG